MPEGTVGVAAEDIPEQCTTRLCDGDPEWAVRFEDGVSRRAEAPPEDPVPPTNSVCPFVCEECRRERYGLIDDDRWVRVAALVTDGSGEQDDPKRTQKNTCTYCGKLLQECQCRPPEIRSRPDPADLLFGSDTDDDTRLYAEYACGNRRYVTEGDTIPATCPHRDCEADQTGVYVDA